VIELRKRLVGILLIMLSLAIVSVTGFVYETAQHTVTQTVKQIATLTLQNSALGNIEEGQTISYTNATVSTLGNIINVTTTKDNVYLHFDSNVQLLTSYYDTYNISVKYAAVPVGSTKVVGNAACTMTLLAPDPAAVTLDKTGGWRFNFEITTTASSVSADQLTTVTIVVTAEST
jgi:hypothetical protein